MCVCVCVCVFVCVCEKERERERERVKKHTKNKKITKKTKIANNLENEKWMLKAPPFIPFDLHFSVL